MTRFLLASLALAGLLAVNVSATHPAFGEGFVPATLVETLTEATLTASAEVEPLAPLGGQCKAFGAIGVCKNVQHCAAEKSQAYMGFCKGDASVKCCVPAVKNSHYNGKKQVKITQTAAERKAEAEHRAKFQRFKQMHGKRYASAAAEAAAYATFKANRDNIIAQNDAHGNGETIFRSTSPYADMDPAEFRAKFLGLSEPSQASAFLEQPTRPSEHDESVFFQMDATETQTAAVQGSCKSGGKTGSCILKSACGTGTIVSGLCPGATYCCIPKSSGPVSPGYTPPNPNEPVWIIPSQRKIPGTLSIDYRSILSPFKDQGGCGSCWAHAALETYETAGVRAGKWTPSESKSVQQVLDCATSAQGSAGCRGAGGPAGLIYLNSANLTMATLKEYPYLGVQSNCMQNPNRPGASGPIKAFGNVNLIGMRCQENPAMNITCPEPNRLSDALAKYGPLMISVDASNWQNYDSGIFNDALCSGRIDHAVQLVGFGSEVDKNGVEQPYWLIRNSWSQNWGEAGYIRVSAKNPAGGCKVAQSPYYAIF